MEKIEIHLGILQRVIFSILKLARLFQYILSALYWNALGAPLAYIAWKVWGDTHNKLRRIHFYKKKKISHIYGLFFVKYIIGLNGWLNGLQSRYSSYDFLLKWNPSVPLIALRHKKATYSISRLDYEKEDEKGLYPVIDGASLGTSEVCGFFIIAHKYLPDQNPIKVSIDCIWLTGAHSGEKFTVNKYGILNNQKSGIHPDAIYFPPKIVVWVFEIIISMAVIVALLNIAYQVWHYNYSSFNKAFPIFNMHLIIQKST
jgi:hypothetical protein